MALLLLHLHLVLLLLKLQMLMVLKNGCGTGRTGASSSCDGTTGDHGRGVVLFLLPGRSSGHGPHLCHELRVVPLEVLVAEDDRIVRSDPTIDLPEPPAVQLACKGRHLDSLEEPRQDLPCERVRVTDDEGPSIVHPCDAVLVGIALCFLRGVVHQRHHLYHKEEEEEATNNNPEWRRDGVRKRMEWNGGDAVSGSLEGRDIDHTLMR
mmetsp:Transcript_57829/g.141267  ORF Transcript_57829/g.141267 Transcript_57829/m.141267 type:complete len:208 (+) Transcript_57829:1286-1909(+)